MNLFCLVNPGLNAPFDMEFDRMTEYTRISRRVYCKLSKCWQFASNVGLILFPVTAILEPNI